MPEAVTVASACDAIDQIAIEQAQALAETQHTPLDAAWRLISTEFLRRCRVRSPVALEADGRATKWRCRARLYNMNRPDEAEADSDPDRPADAMGETVLGGLPAVADWLATLARNFHAGATSTLARNFHAGADVTGLDGATLRHRLKALRPTISRRKGNAVWRVPYQVHAPRPEYDGDRRGPAQVHTQDWMARVDVIRVETTKETETNG